MPEKVAEKVEISVSKKGPKTYTPVESTGTSLNFEQIIEKGMELSSSPNLIDVKWMDVQARKEYKARVNKTIASSYAERIGNQPHERLQLIYVGEIK